MQAPPVDPTGDSCENVSLNPKPSPHQTGPTDVVNAQYRSGSVTSCLSTMSPCSPPAGCRDSGYVTDGSPANISAISFPFEQSPDQPLHQSLPSSPSMSQSMRYRYHHYYHHHHRQQHSHPPYYHTQMATVAYGAVGGHGPDTPAPSSVSSVDDHVINENDSQDDVDDSSGGDGGGGGGGGGGSSVGVGGGNNSSSNNNSSNNSSSNNANNGGSVNLSSSGGGGGGGGGNVTPSCQTPTGQNQAHALTQSSQPQSQTASIDRSAPPTGNDFIRHQPPTFRPPPEFHPPFFTNSNGIFRPGFTTSYQHPAHHHPPVIQHTPLQHNSVQNGPTDLSMKKQNSKNQLSTSEVATIKQLIAGYRESAAFLYRSADELEQLLLQQN